MTLHEELELSYYREAGPIDAEHGITLVQDLRCGKFYVKKVLQVFNPEIYRHLWQYPVKNTPRICLVAEDGPNLVVIEQYIPGDTLEEILREEGVFPLEKAVDIALQLCDILREFHSRSPGIINRDIKPSNIKLTEDGVVKLLDVNAARWCGPENDRDTVLLGTRGYAAPEQYGFGTSAIPADIYAVGVLLNVMLTGEIPAKLPATGAMGKIIAKCTQMDPSRRYPDIAALKAKLLALSRGGIAVENWKRFLLPGFRSGNPVAAVFAFGGYAFLLWCCVDMAVPNAGPMEAALNRVAAFCGFFSAVLFSGNYLNVQKYFFLTRSRKLPVRLIGILIADVLIIGVWVTVLSFVASIMKQAA